MPGLPLLSGRALVKAFEKLGYRLVRQRGSHMRLVCSGRRPVTIPDYKIIDKSLLIKILRDAELTREALREILD